MVHRRSFRGGRGVSESQRRKKAWFGMNVSPGQGNDLSGGGLTPPDLVGAGESSKSLVFLSSGNEALAESTLLRIRGSLDFPGNTISPSNASNEIFCFGIGVVSDTAATFETGIPNPATGVGYDWDGWMFLRSSSLKPADANATLVDVKSMRKWRSGESIVFVAGMATNNVAGMLGQQFQFNLRGLFLLP